MCPEKTNSKSNKRGDYALRRHTQGFSRNVPAASRASQCTTWRVYRLCPLWCWWHSEGHLMLSSTTPFRISWNDLPLAASGSWSSPLSFSVHRQSFLQPLFSTRLVTYACRRPNAETARSCIVLIKSDRWTFAAVSTGDGCPQRVFTSAA